MKKLFISALLAISVAANSFAAENKINSAAASNFKSQFKNASDIQWTSSDDYTKATFVWNNIRTEALYTPEGEFIGTNQAVTLEDLHVSAKRQFAKKYDGYTVKEAIRFEGSKETAYYISAENDKCTVILKVEDSGAMSTVNK